MIHAPGRRRAAPLGAARRRSSPPAARRSRRYSFDFGPFTITGTPRPADGISTAYAPRRTVLDKILVDAAADAGAEVRERFTVDEVVIEDGTVVGIRGRDERRRQRRSSGPAS